jgi:parallel beta-helix repeat protein
VQVIHDIVIADNIAWDCVTGLGCGFIDHDNHDISITGNIFHGTTSAQAVRITGVRITFADNIIEESAGTGLLISDGVALSITGNTVHNCTVNGIDVRDVTNSVISNNIIYDNGAGGIYYTNLYLHAVTRTVVEGNTIFNLVGTDSRCGIEEDTECDYNVIRNNHLFGNRVAQVYRTSTALHSMYGTLRSEHFGPMAIATTTFCHAAEAGDGTAKVVVPTAQPDAPRSCTITTTNNAAPTGSVIITGFNNFGEAATETIVIVPGGTGYGGQPFLQITNYTIPATVGAGDTVSLGLYDCLGLANRINLKSDVFKLKRNKADEPINLASLSLELQSYNFQPIADGDEITIWYFADENYQWQ